KDRFTSHQLQIIFQSSPYLIFSFFQTLRNYTKNRTYFSTQALVPSGPIGNGAPMSLQRRRRNNVVAVRLKKGLTPQT
ncbi:hypothetical protein, partial [Arthrobacter globiformis]|uniref:hypothetical protein n=1 Tax=Arthrobacter globiformis TaxID=1665 RepID=UPI001C2F55F7